MIDADTPLSELRRDFLAGSTLGMPIAGLIVWLALAVSAFWLGDGLDPAIVLYAVAAPFPLAFLVDKLRGVKTIRLGKSSNPLDSLFLRFITVIGVLIVLFIFATQGTGNVAVFVAGLSVLSGLIWVPYGWAAGDPVGLRQFLLRAALAIAAYMLAPVELKVPLVALATALTYAYALATMKRPEDARCDAQTIERAM